MSLVTPIQLSPSPVHEAFTGIEGDPLQKLQLSSPEIALLQAAEANPLDYTLSDQQDAEAYAHVLLKVLDQCNNNTASTSNHVPKVAKLSLQQAPLPDDEALQLLYVDTLGVLRHYAVTKLVAVIQELQQKTSKSSKITVASSFYPSGVVTEEWRPLKRLLTGSISDAWAQRGAAACLAWILAAGLDLQARPPEEDPLYGLVASNNNNNMTSLSSVLESVVTWITSKLASSKETSDVAVVTPALMIFMQIPEARVAFDKAGGLGYLSRHLRVGQKPSFSSSTSSDRLLSFDGNKDNGGNTNTARTMTPPARASSFSRNMNHNASNNSTSVQQLYELTYAVWLLSFDCSVAENDRLRKHFYRDSIVSHLVDLIAAKPREKVVRMALATLKNLALCGNNHRHHEAGQARTRPSTKVLNQDRNDNNKKEPPEVSAAVVEAMKSSPTRSKPTVSSSSGQLSPFLFPTMQRNVSGQDFCKEMVACGLIKPMERMLLSEVKDPDMFQDLQDLKTILNHTFQHMTRWDVYQSEVESTNLQWSMVHTEQFFRENVKKMEGKDGKFGIVRTLIKLATSEDDDVAAIACYDLGEFARHYPNGRSLAKRLGARDVALSLIEHSNAEVQHQALTAVSKMLVLHWQAVR